MKINMTHKYKGAVTHTIIDAFKRRMRGYEVKVLVEKKARDKADRVKK